jgi:hypothetical protein
MARRSTFRLIALAWLDVDLLAEVGMASFCTREIGSRRACVA